MYKIQHITETQISLKRKTNVGDSSHSWRQIWFETLKQSLVEKYPVWLLVCSSVWSQQLHLVYFIVGDINKSSKNFFYRNYSIMLLNTVSSVEMCWLLLPTTKHKNSTAYVDNQINTNILYTIKYKMAKVQHELKSSSWQGRNAEKS